MVGDRQYDMAAANQVGIDSLGVLYGFGTKTELQAAGANYLAADPAAAKNFLQLWKQLSYFKTSPIVRVIADSSR